MTRRRIFLKVIEPSEWWHGRAARPAFAGAETLIKSLLLKLKFAVKLGEESKTLKNSPTEKAQRLFFFFFLSDERVVIDQFIKPFLLQRVFPWCTRFLLKLHFVQNNLTMRSFNQTPKPCGLWRMSQVDRNTSRGTNKQLSQSTMCKWSLLTSTSGSRQDKNLLQSYVLSCHLPMQTHETQNNLFTLPAYGLGEVPAYFKSNSINVSNLWLKTAKFDTIREDESGSTPVCFMPAGGIGF